MFDSISSRVNNRVSTLLLASTSSAPFRGVHSKLDSMTKVWSYHGYDKLVRAWSHDYRWQQHQRCYMTAPTWMLAKAIRQGSTVTWRKYSSSVWRGKVILLHCTVLYSTELYCYGPCILNMCLMIQLEYLSVNSDLIHKHESPPDVDSQTTMNYLTKKYFTVFLLNSAVEKDEIKGKDLFKEIEMLLLLLYSIK